MTAEVAYGIAYKLMDKGYRRVPVTEPEPIDEAPEAGIPPEVPEGVDADEEARLRRARDVLG